MLNLSITSYRPILNLDKEAYSITFNYTETLEVLYKIPQESILHVHGRANSNEEIFSDIINRICKYNMRLKDLG